MANAELENVRLTTAGLQIFEEATIIERASRLAYEYPWEALKLLDTMPTPAVLSFSSLAVIALCHNALRGRNLESDLQAKFYKNLDEYLPGAAVIKKSVHPKMRPDGFVRWRGHEMPVEVKRGAFCKKGLAQLRRYMRHYSCEFGVAVAPSATCVIPSNITFVAMQRGDAP